MAEFPQLSEIHEFKKFIGEHIDDDASRLRLKFHSDNRSWIPLAINHIEAYKKASVKLGALMPALLPGSLAVEQSSAERIARFHGELAAGIAPGCRRFIDFTCGLGIDFRSIVESLPELREATAIEQNGLMAQTARYNFACAGLKNVEVVEADCSKWLEGYSGEAFDLAFIDPARRSDDGARVYNIHDCSPDVSHLAQLFKEKSPLVMVKLSPMLDVRQTLRDLPETTALHIVDDGTECRELLAIIDFRENDAPRGEEATIEVHSLGRGHISYTLADNASCDVRMGIPEPHKWLFEPSPAAMKANLSGILSTGFGLQKLHVNTNLFIADSPVSDLPGRWYEIAEVLDFSSKNIKSFKNRWARADVAVRNFPMAAAQLQKKLGVKSGGDVRVLAVTLRGDARMASHENQALIVLQKPGI